MVGIVREWGVGVVACTAYPLGSASAPPRVGEPTTDSMPAWPTPPGRKCITVELPTEQVDHLDREADYLGCTRVAYLRQLILRDMGRLAPSKAPTKARRAG